MLELLVAWSAGLHIRRVLPNRSTLTFLASLLIAAAVVGWVVHRVDRQSAEHSGPLGRQAADPPPDEPNPVDPWLLAADAWTDAATPVASEACTHAPEGAAVRAVADGVVVFSGVRHGRHAVVLGHRSPAGLRFESIYAPLESVRFRAGQLVGRGMILGERGAVPMGVTLREVPDGVREVAFGKSALAARLEDPDSDAWMRLEIGNAGRMLELGE